MDSTLSFLYNNNNSYTVEGHCPVTDLKFVGVIYKNRKLQNVKHQGWDRISSPSLKMKRKEYASDLINRKSIEISVPRMSACGLFTKDEILIMLFAKKLNEDYFRWGK